MRTCGESPIEASHSQVFPRIGAATLCSWPCRFPIACPAQLQQERAPEEAPPWTVPLEMMHTVLPSFCARRGRLAGLDTRFGRHRTKVETDLLHRCPPVFSAPATDNRALCHCYMRLLAYFPQTSRPDWAIFLTSSSNGFGRHLSQAVQLCQLRSPVAPPPNASWD